MGKQREYDKRWRKKHRKAWAASKKRSHNKGPVNRTKHRKSWDKNDELRIMDPNRPTDRALGLELGRTLVAIRSHRAKLLRLDSPTQSD